MALDYKWNRRFMGLAQHVAQWSKDESTKCGAVIVRPNNSIASLGFNGFPRGIRDHPELLAKDPDPAARQAKQDRVIHAEMNALWFLREREPGLFIYVWPMLPCHRCAVHIIQAGILGVVAPIATHPRLNESMDLSRQLFAEAKLIVQEIEYEEQIGNLYPGAGAEYQPGIGQRPGAVSKEDPTYRPAGSDYDL